MDPIATPCPTGYDSPIGPTSTLPMKGRSLWGSTKLYPISYHDIATFHKVDSTFKLTVAHLRTYLAAILDPDGQAARSGYSYIIILTHDERPVSNDVPLDQTTPAFWTKTFTKPHFPIKSDAPFMGQSWVTATNVHKTFGGAPIASFPIFPLDVDARK